MPYLRQILLQLGPLFLLFEKIPSSVGESRRICGFFLRMRTRQIMTLNDSFQHAVVSPDKINKVQGCNGFFKRVHIWIIKTWEREK